jgi:hypothetical protein
MILAKMRKTRAMGNTTRWHAPEPFRGHTASLLKEEEKKLAPKSMSVFTGLGKGPAPKTGRIFFYPRHSGENPMSLDGPHLIHRLRFLSKPGVMPIER